MRHFYPAIIFAVALITAAAGCRSYELAEPYKSDFTTSGPLGEDCFQAVIKMQPDKGTETMHSRRESAFIKAKKNILAEAGQQIYNYYASCKAGQDAGMAEATRGKLTDKFSQLAEEGIIEQEFYLNDDSIVLIYRIYKKGIKSGIISN